MILDLRQGLTDNGQYKAWKFSGGEVHFQLKNPPESSRTKWEVKTRVNSSDDLMLLILAVDTLRDTYSGTIDVFMPYMPYAQADREFARGESFSLRTIARILNSLPVAKWHLFDVHSDVAPALMHGTERIDNSRFITNVLFWIGQQYPAREVDEEVKTKQDLYFDQRVLENTIWLSPDAGAYKKIGKLADKIGWKGEVAAANKYRSTSSGEIEKVEISHTDFGGKDVLIIDDICMGGRTFIGLAEKLRERNVGKIFLAVSHMINQDINPELGQAFDNIYTTNSRYDEYYMTPKSSQLRSYPPKDKVKIFNVF